MYQYIIDRFNKINTLNLQMFIEQVGETLGEMSETLKIGKVEIIDNTMFNNYSFLGLEYVNEPIVKEFAILERERFIIKVYPKALFDNEKNIVFLADLIGSYYAKIKYENLSRAMATTDAMTTAPNTLGVMSFGEYLQKNGLLKNYHFLFLNLKNFKYVNKQLGMQGANNLLRSYCLTVKTMLDKDEIFGRTGGDNFLAIIKDENLQTFLENIQNINLNVNGINFELPSRIGVYNIEENNSIAEAIERASTANNICKNMKMTNIVFFTIEMQNRLIREKEILMEFSSALKDREFVVYYQPKIDIKNNKMYGAEALVRWIKKTGIVPPNVFIPILEKENDICLLDMYVLDSVCRDLREWLDNSMEPVRVSVNLSRNNLTNKNLAKDVLDIIDKYEIDHKYIELEITETSCYDGQNELLQFIGEMHKNKIKISIDDFGSGYSSINLLKQLSADVVKIDKSLIDSIGADNMDDTIIVRNVVNMINELGMEVVAEGVETGEQVQFLKNINCNIIQGYYFSKPVPKGEYVEKLINNK